MVDAPWLSDMQIELSGSVPLDLKSESCSSSRAAFWAASHLPKSDAKKLRKSRTQFPPSSFSPPVAASRLSFYTGHSPASVEPDTSAQPQTRAKLRKLPPSISSLSDYQRHPTRHSTTLDPNDTPQSTFLDESPSSDSGHTTVPRHQSPPSVRNSLWLPPSSPHSTSQLSPIIATPFLEAQDLFGPMAASQTTCLSDNLFHPSPTKTHRHSASLPLSPVTTNATQTESQQPCAMTSLVSNPHQSSTASRSKSLSKIARALSFKRPKGSSSHSEAVQPTTSPPSQAPAARRSRFHGRSSGRSSRRRPATASGAPGGDSPNAWGLSVSTNPTDENGVTQSPIESIPLGPVVPIATPRAASSPVRPCVVRRQTTGSYPRRRWSLTGMLMDGEVTNEYIIQELEKMRALRKEWRTSGGSSPAGSLNPSVCDGGDAFQCASPIQMDYPTLSADFFDGLQDDENLDEYEDEASVFGGPTHDDLYGAKSKVPFPSTPPCPVPWNTTRRVLLVIRELVNTEQSYLSSLRMLLSASCTPAPPPQMLPLIQELESISSSLLDLYRQDTTVWGVSRAFLITFGGFSEEDIENYGGSHHGKGFFKESEPESGGAVAFYQWAACVGQWFDDVARDKATTSKSKNLYSNPSRRLSKSRPVFTIGSSAQSSIDDLADSPTPVTPNPEDEVLNGAPSPVLDSGENFSKKSGGGSISTKTSKPNTWRKSFSATSPSSNGGGPLTSNSNISISSIVNPFTKAKEEKGSINGKRLPPVRDLAIQPTQRIMRYVMVYQELLSNTPHSSVVRPLIEIAVQACLRIADKSDRAQVHAAFLRNTTRPV